jgi:hypothetical protein
MQEEVRNKLIQLDTTIANRFKDDPTDESSVTDYFAFLSDHESFQDESITPSFEPIEEPMTEADNFDVEGFDKYLAAQVVLPKGDTNALGTVVAQKRGISGYPIGKANNNPIFDTRVYQVQLPDGHIEQCSANVIAECLYSQIDNEGNQYLLLDALLDHQCIDDATNTNNPGPTTHGWSLCVLWKDGSTSSEPLKDLKQAFPVQVAEYAVSRDLTDSPAFKWWVPHTLKQRNHILKAIKTHFHNKTHKYGIQVPKTVEEAYALDRESGTDYWHQAILKEMKNNAIAFKFLESGDSIPVGSKWIPCHMVFDVKIDLTRKARFVAGGHWTEPDHISSYSTVIS